MNRPPMSLSHFCVFLFVTHPVPNGVNCHQSVKLVSYYFSCLRLNSYLFIFFFVIITKNSISLVVKLIIYSLYIHLSAQLKKNLCVPQAPLRHIKQCQCFLL